MLIGWSELAGWSAVLTLTAAAEFGRNRGMCASERVSLRVVWPTQPPPLPLPIGSLSVCGGLYVHSAAAVCVCVYV